MTSSDNARPSAPARLSVRGVSKTFAATKALDAVDLDFRDGEIHALCGGNGSGKSTLIKILTGVYQADAGGEIRSGERIVSPDHTSPETAKELGIHAVHQDLGVFPELSVAENLALGFGFDTTAGKIRWRRLKQRAEVLIDRFEIDARPETPLTALSQGVRTQVAIARALQDTEAGGLLILDEPTASLPAHEVQLLLETLKQFARKGQAILYVSHRLDEVLAISDRVSVLRDGRMAGTYDASELSEDRLIELIAGRQLEDVFPDMPEVADAAPTLKVSNVSVGPIRNASFEVLPGEVVGLAGLLGSGRTEILRAVFGDLSCPSGAMELEGTPYRPKRPGDAMRRGVALVPENRAVDAAFSDLPIADNIAAPNVPQYFKRMRLARGRIRSDGRRLMQEFLVKAASEADPLATLSGGNQQKVILARWLRRQPRLLLLDEPTQGVDVGARSEIYNLVRDAVSRGAAAIVVASDFEELAHVCDRVLVIRDGQIAAEVPKCDLSAERLTQLLYRKKTGALS